MVVYSAIGLGDVFTNVKKSWIVLATGSLDRARLMINNVGVTNVLLLPSNFEENLDKNDFATAGDYCSATAQCKAQLVAEAIFNANTAEQKQEVYSRLIYPRQCDYTVDLKQVVMVIGCDTVGEFHGQIFEKPKDRQAAKMQLETYQKGEHCIITGVAIYCRKTGPNECLSRFYEVTRLLCGKLDPIEIEHLLDRNEHQGIAGSFRISGLGEGLVEEMHGHFSTVVGLPAYKTSRAIAEIYQKYYPEGAPLVSSSND